MTVKELFIDDNMPYHMIAVMPDDTIRIFLTGPFRNITEDDMVTYNGEWDVVHAESAPEWMYLVYGLKKDE